MKQLELIIAEEKLVEQLKKLSTENLIIWLIGKSNDLKKLLTSEEIVVESWLINPEKHSLRGFSQFPDASVIKKRIGEMKGKKGLLTGSEMGGYNLTELSKEKYAILNKQLNHKGIIEKKGVIVADRTISSIEQASYNKLIRTPAYQKFISNRKEQIVESDFLYFYGINWHTKPAQVLNKMKNINHTVDAFSTKDITLITVRNFLNTQFQSAKENLLR